MKVSKFSKCKFPKFQWNTWKFSWRIQKLKKSQISDAGRSCTADLHCPIQENSPYRPENLPTLLGNWCEMTKMKELMRNALCNTLCRKHPGAVHCLEPCRGRCAQGVRRRQRAQSSPHRCTYDCFNERKRARFVVGEEDSGDAEKENFTFNDEWKLK